jgi:hypothetical protein
MVVADATYLRGCCSGGPLAGHQAREHTERVERQASEGTGHAEHRMMSSVEAQRQGGARDCVHDPHHHDEEREHLPVLVLGVFLHEIKSQGKAGSRQDQVSDQEPKHENHEKSFALCQRSNGRHDRFFTFLRSFQYSASTENLVEGGFPARSDDRGGKLEMAPEVTR